MLVHNKSKRNYVHAYMDENYKLQMLTLAPGAHMEIPDDVAKSWIKGTEVVEYVNPKQAQEEKKKLEEENARLKAQLAQQNGDDIETLKAEADALGISYSPRIGVAKLKEKIEAFKAEQE